MRTPYNLLEALSVTAGGSLLAGGNSETLIGGDAYENTNPRSILQLLGLIVGIVSIVATCISIVVTIASIRQTKRTGTQKSNRPG